MDKQDKTDMVMIPQEAVTPMQMLSIAVSQGADLDRMERLMALQERWEANEARKAFNLALSRFKAEAITIDKDGDVNYKNSKGDITSYRHATLGNICKVLSPALSAHGLSFRWETQQIEGRIVVTCILAHEMGHSASVSLDGGADTSGGKNNIQAVGSTVSYLQRYTLLSITGTATSEQDDDGRSVESGSGDNAGSARSSEEIVYVTDERFAELCSDKLDKETGEIKKMGWKSIVQSGKKTAEDLIAWAQSNGNLTEAQQKTIRGWEKKGI
jgi:hypothetical protein